MHPHARRLAADAEPRGRARPQHRARLVRQRRARRAHRGRCGRRAISRSRPASCRSDAAHTSRTSPSSASTHAGIVDVAAPGQHAGRHMREHHALGADAIEFGGDLAPAHVKARRAIELVALHDVRDRRSCPAATRLSTHSRVAGEGQHLAVRPRSAAHRMAHRTDGSPRTASPRTPPTSSGAARSPSSMKCSSKRRCTPVEPGKQGFGRRREARLDARRPDRRSAAPCAWRHAGHGSATTPGRRSGRHAGAR